MKKLFLAGWLLLSFTIAALGQGLPGAPVPQVPIGGSSGGGGGAGGVNNFSLLARSGVASAVTGTGTETPLATVSVPANTLGANGEIRINAYWTMTNNADSKTLRVRLGGVGITGSPIMSIATTTIGFLWSATMVIDLNATNSQSNFNETARGTDGLVQTTNTTSAIDMTAAQNIVFSGLLGTTTDTITLVGYSIEYVN